MGSGIFIVCFLILFSINISLSDLNEECAENAANVDRILTSLHNALVFLGKEYSSLNLDVISGLRMTQAEFKAAVSSVQHLAPGSNIPAIISEMSKYIDGLISLSEPYVYKTLPVYYNNFAELLSIEFWKVSDRKKGQILMNNPNVFGMTNVEIITEAASDNCLTELLGTGPSRTKCTITSSCLNIMGSDGYIGYEITHQLLYFMLIDRLRCFSNDRLHQQQNEHIIRGLCSNIYQQSIDVAEAGFNGRIDHDLFMEQIAFCGGLLGYDEFLRSDWLNHILSWQLKTGCFSIVNPPSADNQNTYRRKRMDVKLDGGYGCFGHCTAVAIISLGGYLRAEIENMKSCSRL